MKNQRIARIIFFCTVFCLGALSVACRSDALNNNAQPSVAAAQGMATADNASAISTPRSTRTSSAAPAPTNVRSASKNNFPAIARTALPTEAHQTLRLIERGGPFPYRQDGQIFQNREGRLPKKSNGYYHEYTVETPGSDDRGARRIVTGGDGEMYYTADHYNSFKLIVDD